MFQVVDFGRQLQVVVQARLLHKQNLVQFLLALALDCDVTLVVVKADPLEGLLRVLRFFGAVVVRPLLVLELLLEDLRGSLVLLDLQLPVDDLLAPVDVVEQLALVRARLYPAAGAGGDRGRGVRFRLK